MARIVQYLRSILRMELASEKTSARASVDQGSFHPSTLTDAFKASSDVVSVPRYLFVDR